MYLYSALFVVAYSQGAKAWITHATTPMPAFASYAFTRWLLPRLRLRTSYCSLLLIYLPQKDERLSWPGWLTYSGRFTHISGHPSAADRAQDRDSSPVKDRRSTAVQRNQVIASMSHSTHYRSCQGWSYRSDDPTNSVIVLKDNG